MRPQSGMKAMINVAILDPHALSRHGMGVLLTQAADEITVAKTMVQTSDLDPCLYAGACDVLLLSDAISTETPVNSLVCHIQQSYPEVRVLILSQMLHLGYIQQLMHDGARGFLYKEDPVDEILLVAIRMVMRGELYFSPRASALPFQQHLSNLNGLSVRECQVLRMLSTGLTVSEIGEALHIDIKTVYRSRDKLKDILGVRTNEQIVPTARTRGLLSE